MAARPVIRVLAGVNGAGKSSVLGSGLRQSGGDWYNPDDLTRALVREGLNLGEANARAWEYGRAQLARAIESQSSFAFETTLGGDTIAAMLLTTTRTHDVQVFYCGLTSPELHLARVALRGRHGGHDIPEGKIRQRWESSRMNLLRLIPHLAVLRVFDNSATAADGARAVPPRLLLDVRDGVLRFPRHDDVRTLRATPDWAKPIVEAALRLG